MKRSLLFCVAALLSILNIFGQVTQINNNKSLQVIYPLSSSKTIVISEIDSSIWVSDATLPGTVQISPTVKFEGEGGVIGGSFIFRGSTTATGSEIYKTDGTPGGTVLVKDIVGGSTGSDPGDFAPFNGFIYFSASTAADGRELWRTDGTAGNTNLFKDIKPGVNGSNTIDNYNITSGPSYFLFAAQGATEGIELWKSDGSAAGTVLLKDINTGNAGADSSNPREFYYYNSMFLFLAADATHGEEIWKTDGTPGGTSLVKDINTGTTSSTVYNYSPVPGFNFPYPIFFGFHTFNNKVYFNATDGASVGEIWSSDGTAGNTTLLKDIVPGAFDPLNPIPTIFVIVAVNLPTKFIFGVSDHASQNELWESDGTPGGTKVFKSFTPVDPTDFPFVFVPYSINYSSMSISQQLFMGSKFFFVASTSTQGYELWISDGTVAGTNIVKDINPGAASAIDPSNSISYLYTNTNLFFAATDATHGNELWKTDGTSANTSLVQDIYLNAGNASPQLALLNPAGTIFFTATDGDDVNHTDLFVVNGTFQPLPIQLLDFAVAAKTNDALLQWSTSREINSKSFTIQRSYDAQNFEDVGTLQSVGNSSGKTTYSFTDAGIVNSGKAEVYYRLLLTDEDGKFAWSKVILLKLKNTKWSVKVISNPVKNGVHILLQGITGDAKISIIDASGRRMYSKQYNNTNGDVYIDTRISTGTYLLEAIYDGERKIIKFVK